MKSICYLGYYDNQEDSLLFLFILSSLITF